MTKRYATRLPSDASLDQQIRRIEQRLMRRRESSREHMAGFRRQVRERMASPVILLLAGGLGFALSAFTGSKPAPSSSTSAPRPEGVRLLSTMVTMVSLGGSVMTLWQRFKSVSRPAGRVPQTTPPDAQENTPA